MVLPIALALWAGTLKKAHDVGERNNALADEEIAKRRDDREYTQGERARVAKMRDDVASAAAPRNVETMPMPQYDDEGNPNPLPDRYSVGGTSYGDQAQAQGVANAANDPAARTARMSQALESNGDIVGAQHLRTGARQEAVAGLQLDEATRKAINQKFDDSIDALPSMDFNGIAGLVSNSKADGQGGALKIKAVPTADGKQVQFVKVNPDGTEAILPNQVYDNTPKGYLEAQLFLKKNVSTEQKLAHLHQTAQEETARATQQSTDRYHNSMAGYYDKMAAAAGVRADAAMTRAEGGGGGKRGDHFDEKEWDAAQKVEPGLVTFTSPDSGKAVESPDLRLTYVHELNAARASGDMSPTQAAEKARTTVVLLRNKATEMAEASGGKMSEQKAVQKILADYAKANAAPAPPPGPGPKTATPKQAQAAPAAPVDVPSLTAAPAVAPAAPTQQAKQARALQIQQALAADDELKQGGVFGMGGRALRAGRLPMGMGARRDLELELQQLTQGR